MAAGKSIIPKITKADRELLRRSLNTMLWVEREQCVSVARDLYVIDDGKGGAKRFDGDWKALREWAAQQPPKSMPLGLAAYDRLEVEINALLKKLED